MIYYRMNNLVSIITPSFNSARFIEECIDSVLSQTYDNWELLIVDDCSSDNSCELIAGYHDKRITLIGLEENVGAAEARNIAIRQAKGKYIARHDADDISLSVRFEKQIYWLINQKYEAVFSRAYYNSKKRITPRFSYLFPKYILLNFINPFIHGSMIVKKNKLLNENSLNLKDYYISIGRLTKQKNFIFLIECFKEIIKSNPYIKLVIIGEGEQYSRIKKIIKESKIEKNIFLLGYQNNVFNYLYNSKGFILPSLWEDPGFVIVEAIFCNVPVLSSNCSSGPKEIIGYDKGILFENNSKEDFIRKFHQFNNLNTNEKNSYIYNAKKFIKRFTLFSHYNELKKIIV